MLSLLFREFQMPVEMPPRRQVKRSIFEIEPMGERPVSDIPGIGRLLTKRLADKGIQEVRFVRNNYDPNLIRTFF